MAAGSARIALRRLLVFSCGVVLVQAHVQGPLASSSPQGPDVSVVCAAERAVVHPGDTVNVRAWATNRNGEPVAGVPRFAWRAGSGTISGAERALWRLDGVILPTVGGVELGVPAAATVDIDVPGHGAGRCELKILVAPRPSDQPLPGDPRRSERLMARTLLLKGKTEPLEYGLRSYVLFSTPPRDASQRERYLKTIEAYLLVLVPLEDFLEQHVRPSQLNVTMFPAVRPVNLPAAVNDPSRVRAVAAELLDAYDYARARVLLTDLDVGTIGSGPYLVSRAPRATAAGLLVDMTGVSAALIWDWMTWFSWLTGQERSWSEAAVRRLGLNLRNVIAVAGSITPVVLESAGRWVFILRPR